MKKVMFVMLLIVIVIGVILVLSIKNNNEETKGTIRYVTLDEIKEIMNGNIKIFNMRVEGETISFDTPYNSNWNFMPRDFEQIIDTLQQENTQLKEFKKEHEIMKKILTIILDSCKSPI